MTRKIALMLALVMSAFAVHADDGINWMDPGQTLFTPKVTLTPLKPTDDPRNFTRAQDLNSIAEMLYDIRTYLLDVNARLTNLDAAFQAHVNQYPLAPPNITSCDPSSVSIGTVITCYGSGFSGLSSVTIGTVVASFTAVSDATLTVVTPVGATSNDLVATNSAGSDTWPITVVLNAPGPVTYPSAVAEAYNQITVSWSAPEDGATPDLYSVYYALDNAGQPGTWTKRGDTPANQLYYTLIGLQASTKYWFYIVATSNTDGSGPPSQYVSATTPAQTPTGVTSVDLIASVSVAASGSVTVTGNFVGGTISDTYLRVSSYATASAPGATDNNYGTITSTGVYTAPAGATGSNYAKVWSISKADSNVNDSAVVNITSVAYPPTIQLTAQVPQPTATSLPAVGVAYHNEFGTDAYDTVTKRISADWYHHYSKDPMWNRDMTYLRMQSYNNRTDDTYSRGNMILDAQTFAVYRQMDSVASGEHRTWGNTVANKWYIFGATGTSSSGPFTWIKGDIRTGHWTVVHDYDNSTDRATLGISSFSALSYGRYEGRMDTTDTYAPMVANTKVPFIINVSDGTIKCVVTSSTSASDGNDGVRTVGDSNMSQDGTYMTVVYVGYGMDVYNTSDCSWKGKLFSTESHTDNCVLADGTTQVVAGGCWASTLPYGMCFVKMGDANGSTLPTKYYFYTADKSPREHISCTNFDRPGWAYMSHDLYTPDTTTYNAKYLHRIISMKLDDNCTAAGCTAPNTVEQYAWDNGPIPSTYEEAPSVNVSPDGSKVVWKTSWNGMTPVLNSTSGIHEVNSFMAGKVVP